MSESESRRALLGALGAAHRERQGSGAVASRPLKGDGKASAKAGAEATDQQGKAEKTAVKAEAPAGKSEKKQGKEGGPGAVLQRDEVEPLCGSLVPEAIADNKFYLTTAIFYTNGAPHMGHAYESASSDVIVRYHRAYGRKTFFLTGSDEHGQKVEKAGIAAGVTPLQIADQCVGNFKALNKMLLVEEDFYIRTTSARHKALARKVWEKVKANGDIYLKNYEGWYNVYDEAYVTDKEAEEKNFQDEHGRPFERKSEESYFFRMSKYQERIIRYITEDNPNFVQPDSRKREMLAFLKEPLQDLCISRTVCQWGVQCPPDPEYTGDKNHVMYVWFDALTNYLSGINYLCSREEDPEDLQSFWPVNVHIVGKDILRFHTIIWPCMLMSAGIPLPRTVFGHGFVVAADGVKMSKSLGNVTDPVELLKIYPSDTVRFYLAAAASYGSDMPFSEESMCMMHNSTLNNGMGNMVHRTTSLCAIICDGKVPEEAPLGFPFDLKNLKVIFELSLAADPSTVNVPADFSNANYPGFSVSREQGLQLHTAALALIEAINSINRYIQDQAPWKITATDEESMAKKRGIIRAALEGIYAIGHFLEPFAPESSGPLYHKLGVRRTKICLLRDDFVNLPPGTQTYVGPILYPELKQGVGIVVQQTVQDMEAAKKARQAKMERDIADKKAKKDAIAAQNAAKKKEGAEADDPNQPEFTKLDFRVGRITKVWHHESAEKLFCETIDVGEDAPRSIASGLREHYELADMEGRLVVVCCNLKPRKLAGFESNGMVICASAPDKSKVEILTPPAGAKIGERLFLQGRDVDEYEPADPNKVSKKKIFEAVAPKLLTDGQRQATWDGILLQTSAGPCTVPSLCGANLS